MPMHLLCVRFVVKSSFGDTCTRTQVYIAVFSESCMCVTQLKNKLYFGVLSFFNLHNRCRKMKRIDEQGAGF